MPWALAKVSTRTPVAGLYVAPLGVVEAPPTLVTALWAAPTKVCGYCPP